MVGCDDYEVDICDFIIIFKVCNVFEDFVVIVGFLMVFMFEEFEFDCVLLLLIVIVSELELYIDVVVFVVGVV